MTSTPQGLTDQWLAENLNVLAGMISEETARSLKIPVFSTPKS
jgi:hypothetical protein